MALGHFKCLSAALFACGMAGVLTGCQADDSRGITRMHLENEGDAAVTFLAISTSEEALDTAENRLAKPLVGGSVYSAALSRPGNYWVRAELDTEGYTISRIEGPIRVGTGICDWRLQKIDARPLYAATRAAYEAAGRKSLSSN